LAPRSSPRSTSPIPVGEVLLASGIACGIGLGITFLETRKVHFRLANKIGLTKKLGEFDVWGYVFNSESVEWATVRDHRNGFAYDGWVKLFSDDSERAELLLSNVDVHKNDTGQHLYSVASLYLSLARGDITIELRDARPTEETTDGSRIPARLHS